MAFRTCSADSSAPVEAVWRVWSQPSTWPDWNPDVSAISLDGPLTPGARGSMTTRRGGTHAVEIESVEPGKAFVLVSTGLPGHRLAFRCEVVPSGLGSRLSQGVEIRGPLAGLLSSMMTGKIAASFEPILQGLARAAESSAA